MNEIVENTMISMIEFIDMTKKELKKIYNERKNQRCRERKRKNYQK